VRHSGIGLAFLDRCHIPGKVVYLGVPPEFLVYAHTVGSKMITHVLYLFKADIFFHVFDKILLLSENMNHLNKSTRTLCTFHLKYSIVPSIFSFVYF